MSEKPQIEFLRHSGWFQPLFVGEDVITIIGCGAVGSTVAIGLARLGFHRFHLIDGDVVEGKNCANQAFYERHIGMPKVTALAEVLREVNRAVEVSVQNEFLVAEQIAALPSGSIILAVDSIAARRMVVENLLGQDRFLLEARLSFYDGQYRILDCQNVDDALAFLETLPDEHNTSEGPCGLRLCYPLISLVQGLLSHSLSEHYKAKFSKLPFKYSSVNFFGMKEGQVSIFHMAERTKEY